MAMNRVQFQRGLSMAEFLDRYGSEDKCEAALVAARWPKGFACPACGSGVYSVFVRSARRYWQCGVCRPASLTPARPASFIRLAEECH
jgi:ribosomal protein L37AE/L43A